MKTFQRQFAAEVKILDEKEGIVEYVASDESIDHDGEIVRAKGWKFTHFKKNAPFVDSHDYSSISKQLGKVIAFEVKGERLVETVQWAKDAHELARIGWELTKGGFLKAVSVGFRGVKAVWRGDQETASAWRAQLRQLGLEEDAPVRRIFLQQEQLELSSVIVPANPNAVMRMAKACKAGCLADSDIDFLTREFAKQTTRASNTAASGGAGEANLLQACKRFEHSFQNIISKI